MAAEFKSHVLRREEKGALGVPFKRLLLAGVGGGLVYTLGKIALPDWALPLAFAAGGLLLYFTATLGGLPRWQRLLYRVRGSLMLAAAEQPRGMLAHVAAWLELPSGLTTLEASTLFAPPVSGETLNMDEWVTFAQAQDADHDDGLSLVGNPAEVK
jgi:hypothetical protein